MLRYHDMTVHTCETRSSRTYRSVQRTEESVPGNEEHDKTDKRYKDIDGEQPDIGLTPGDRQQPEDDDGSDRLEQKPFLDILDQVLEPHNRLSHGFPHTSNWMVGRSHERPGKRPLPDISLSIQRPSFVEKWKAGIHQYSPHTLYKETNLKITSFHVDSVTDRIYLQKIKISESEGFFIHSNYIGLRDGKKIYRFN